jgi:hypothetical protein
VLGPSSESKISNQTIDDKDIYSYFYQLTNFSQLGRRAALTQTAHKFGLSTKLVYAVVERLKNSPAP